MRTKPRLTALQRCMVQLAQRASGVVKSAFTPWKKTEQWLGSVRIVTISGLGKFKIDVDFKGHSLYYGP
jgi:hypothetical protein